jgi:hypothetical protein
MSAKTASSKPMNDVSRQKVESIIAFCRDKYQEAMLERPITRWWTPEIQTGRKMAYHEVMQFVRTLLSEGT